MKEKYLTRRWNNIFSIVILIATMVLVIVATNGLIKGWFASFTALVVIGGVGCGGSEGQSAMRFVRVGWGIKKRIKNPLTIAGVILGIIALLLIIFTYSKMDFGLITGYNQASVALTVLILVLIGLNLRRNVIAPS